ncbi:MAG: hypothetical protein ACM3NQ_16350 [Bacteroidales bacterium]
MARTLAFEELKHMTVAELRDIAAGLPQEAVKGYTQLNKEHLLKVICGALHIDMHAHHVVVGVNKADIKAQIRQLKKERDHAIDVGNHEELHVIRRRMHHLKRELHKATV